MSNQRDRRRLTSPSGRRPSVVAVCVRRGASGRVRNRRERRLSWRAGAWRTLGRCCLFERVREHREGLDHGMSAFARPPGKQRLELGLERLDEALGEALPVGGQLDDRHSAVALLAASVEEAAAGGAVNEPADVGAIAAQDLGQVTDRGRSNRSAQEFRLLGRQPKLPAGLRVSGVHRDSQSSQCLWDGPWVRLRLSAVHRQEHINECDTITYIRSIVT